MWANMMNGQYWGGIGMGIGMLGMAISAGLMAFQAVCSRAPSTHSSWRNAMAAKRKQATSKMKRMHKCFPPSP